MDSFYNSIGGLAGYQLKCLEMILGSKKDSPAEQPSAEPSIGAEEGTKYHMPQGLNIAYNRRAAAAAAATGLEALPHMGEILPLGGTSLIWPPCRFKAAPCLTLSLCPDADLAIAQCVGDAGLSTTHPSVAVASGDA